MIRTATRFGAVCLLCGVAGVRGETPELPRVTAVPPTSQAPLSSAERRGTEFADLAAAGYVAQEFYLSGIAPAITAQETILFQAPYITRILVRKPRDPARFNGTVIIEPLTWIGERGAGWILTKDYLLRVYVNSWGVTAQVWMDCLDQGRHQQWRMPDGPAAGAGGRAVRKRVQPVGVDDGCARRSAGCGRLR